MQSLTSRLMGKKLETDGSLPSNKDTQAAKSTSCCLLTVFVFAHVCVGSSTCHHSNRKASSRVFACVCPQAGEQMGIPLTQQASNESRLSMSESVSEFFDAQEVLLSASSSENEVYNKRKSFTANE